MMRNSFSLDELLMLVTGTFKAMKSLRKRKKQRTQSYR